MKILSPLFAASYLGVCFDHIYATKILFEVWQLPTIALWWPAADYLFPSMIFEPAVELTPPYKQGIYSYTFELPPTSKFYGPHTAFYLFAGQLRNKTVEIVINQDGQFFQTLTEKQYWQSNKSQCP